MNSKAIFLCGFMGCGKSTIGKLLARKTGKSFIDLDSYIEEQEKMSIPEIFEKHGEEYFRTVESKALTNFGQSGAVVATGGGALLSSQNGDIAKKAGNVVYIDTPFPICYDRIKYDKNRPIAYNSTKEELWERYQNRRPLYMRNSNVTVSGKGSPINIAMRILNAIR